MLREQLLTILFMLCLLPTPAANAIEAPEQPREWKFRVLLDGKPVGEHRFVLEPTPGDQTLRLETTASFEVKFLFATLYDYRHNNVETWRNDCLVSIDAETDANGTEHDVEGQRRDDAFVLEADGDTERLPECVKTFAYWNPEFLSADRLLNAQNGEYVSVEITEPEETTLEVRGEQRSALRYQIKSDELDIQLWYSPDREWLALESQVKGGRTLRYDLM